MVRETVISEPGWALAWPSGTVPTFCGHSNLPFFTVGTHHCDRTTFVIDGGGVPLFSTDIRATAVLIHESGHGMQERAGIDVVVPSLQGDVGQQNPMEQSADCWAGTGIAHLVTNGDLPARARTEAGDLMAEIGADQPGTMHGTGAERRAAFEQGYTRGPAACDEIAGHRIFS